MRPRHRIPQTDGIVPTTTGKYTTIRAERYTTDRERMSPQRPLMRPCRRIPKTDGIVPTTTGKHLTVPAERYAIDILSMSFQHSPLVVLSEGVWRNQDEKQQCA